MLQPHEILDFDGSQFKEIISSYKQQAIDADALVDNFLKYYPHEAFLITADEYVVMTDPYRNSYIEIPYTIQWNDEFLYALEEISGLVGSRDPVLKVPKIVLKNRSVYYFYDKITFGNINKAFDNTEYIRITVINSINETLLNTCVQSIKYSGITGASLDRYSVMYSNSGYDLIIKGNKQVSNIARIDLTDDLVNLIDNQVKIKLSVISIDLCYE